MTFPDQPINDETEADEEESHGNADMLPAEAVVPLPISSEEALASSRKYVAYTVKLPSEQLAALQTIWLELKRLYGADSPDKSGMIQQAITEWLRRWDGPDRQKLLQDLLEIRQDTRRRQYRK